MFSYILDKISFFSYYFFIPRDIDLTDNELKDNDINVEEDYKTYMIEVSQYFKWRRYSIILMLPVLCLDFILNIINHYNVDKYYSHLNNSVLEDTNDLSIDWNKTSHFIIELTHPKNTKEFMTFYTVATSLFIFTEIVFVMVALVYSKKWLLSAKYMRYAFITSIIWIYLIYFNPLIKYLKLESNLKQNDILQSYVYIFIIGNLLKEIIPIMIAFFEGTIWGSINLKYLFPSNPYLGWIYKYFSITYMLTMVFLLLLVNQIFDNYLVSFGLFL